MSEIKKIDVLLELYRDEILNNAKKDDDLFNEIDRLLIENSDLKEEVSEQHYQIQRLKDRIEGLKLVKMGNYTDEILKSCDVTDILRNKKSHWQQPVANWRIKQMRNQLNEIFDLSIRINYNTKHAAIINYYGHANSLHVEVVESKASFENTLYKTELYMNAD